MAIRTLLERRRVTGVWQHLPYIGRLADAPRVQTDPADESRLVLRGVVCGLCADRTRTALESVSGVEEVTVDLHQSEARIRVAPGARVDEELLQRALERAVVGMSVRRWLERAMRQVVARTWWRGRRIR